MVDRSDHENGSLYRHCPGSLPAIGRQTGFSLEPGIIGPAGADGPTTITAVAAVQRGH